MKHAQKYRIFLVIPIGAWIMFFPAYVHSYILSEADFLCFNPQWEDPVLEGQLMADLEKKWGASACGVHFCIFSHENSQPELLPHLSFQDILPVERDSVLRC
jgi:hypothetical protein